MVLRSYSWNEMSGSCLVSQLYIIRDYTVYGFNETTRFSMFKSKYVYTLSSLDHNYFSLSLVVDTVTVAEFLFCDGSHGAGLNILK